MLARRSLAVTPNHVTIVAILVGLIASLLASRGGYANFAIAGVLLELNSILDSCDGELARLRYQYCKLGQWLDNLSRRHRRQRVLHRGRPRRSAASGSGSALAAACGRLLVSLVDVRRRLPRTGTGDVFAFRWWFESDKATADDVYDPKAITTLAALVRAARHVRVPVDARVPGGLSVLGDRARPRDRRGQRGLLVLHFTVFRHRR